MSTTKKKVVEINVTGSTSKKSENISSVSKPTGPIKDEIKQEDALNELISNELLTEDTFQAIAKNQMLSADNTRLKEEVATKDSQLLELSEAVISLRDELDVLREQDLQKTAQDIAKRNRMLSAELNRIRAKNIQLTKENDELKNSYQDIKNLLHQQSMQKELEAELDNEDSLVASTVREAQQWQQKYNQSMSRLVELRSQLSVFRSENSKLIQLLKREVGDDFNPNSPNKYWKGRSEEITILKQKLKEVRMSIPVSPGTKSQLSSLEERNKQTIENFQKIKRQELQAIQSENEELKKENAKLKFKFDGNTARIQVMDNDLRNLREKIKILIDKSTNDDKLIDGLHEEISIAKTVASNQSIQKVKIARDDTNTKQLEYKVSELEKSLAEKSHIISQLKDQRVQQQMDFDRVISSWGLADQSYSNNSKSILKSLNQEREENEIVKMRNNQLEERCLHIEQEKTLIEQQLSKKKGSRIAKKQNDGDKIEPVKSLHDSLAHYVERNTNLQIRLKEAEEEAQHSSKIASQLFETLQVYQRALNS